MIFDFFDAANVKIIDESEVGSIRQFEFQSQAPFQLMLFQRPKLCIALNCLIVRLFEITFAIRRN
jgi:hypothetical protein